MFGEYAVLLFKLQQTPHTAKCEIIIIIIVYLLNRKKESRQVCRDASETTMCQNCCGGNRNSCPRS